MIEIAVVKGPWRVQKIRRAESKEACTGNHAFLSSSTVGYGSICTSCVRPVCEDDILAYYEKLAVGTFDQWLRAGYWLRHKFRIKIDRTSKNTLAVLLGLSFSCPIKAVAGYRGWGDHDDSWHSGVFACRLNWPNIRTLIFWST